jgi:hypothetical protein
VLRPQNEANKKTATPNVKRWFEPMPDTPEESNLATATAMKERPEDSVSAVVRTEPETRATDFSNEPPPVVEREFLTLPDGTKRRIKPQQPTEDIYEWSHVMDYSSFRVKTPWRQQQLIAQWKENEVLGGKHVNLRGKPKSGPCFGSCPMGNCTCNDREDF